MKAQINPSLIEKEMILLFLNTFRKPYFEYLVGQLILAFHLCSYSGWKGRISYKSRKILNSLEMGQNKKEDL